MKTIRRLCIYITIASIGVISCNMFYWLIFSGVIKIPEIL